MTWYADLSRACMIDQGEQIRAVGWLSPEHPFPTGHNPPEFVNRLKELCCRWQEGLTSLGWGVFMGVYECELCGLAIANGNIGVPAGKLLFVAPVMIAHYVETHQYTPPSEFTTALLASPLPGTPEYSQSVAAFRDLQSQSINELL